MLDGCSGELVMKDWNTQHKNSIYLSPDRTEIYLIGGICLPYAYIRKIEGVEPAMPIFFWAYCAHSCFGTRHACCASWLENTVEPESGACQVSTKAKYK